MPYLILGCGNQPSRKSGCSLGDIVLNGWALPLVLGDLQTVPHMVTERDTSKGGMVSVEEIKDVCGKRKS